MKKQPQKSEIHQDQKCAFFRKSLEPKKANNSNKNTMRVYGDVIHTGQRPGLERFWLPVVSWCLQTVWWGEFKNYLEWTAPESVMKGLKWQNGADWQCVWRSVTLKTMNINRKRFSSHYFITCLLSLRFDCVLIWAVPLGSAALPSWDQTPFPRTELGHRAALPEACRR